MLNVNPEMVVKTLREEIKRRPRTVTYQDIANEIEGVDAEWISKFCKGVFKMPPFDKVCKLYAWHYKTNTIAL